MIRTILFLGLLIASFTSFAQTPAQIAAVKLQAKTMVDALVKKDYNTFAKYTNPTVIQKMGGAAKMAESLKTGQSKLSEQGVAFKGVTLGEPSPILTVGKELQCTIPQTTEMKMQLGRVLAKSTLIAISADKGKNWTFTDAAGKDLTALRTALPNLSDKLVIPKMQQPQFLPE